MLDPTSIAEAMLLFLACYLAVGGLFGAAFVLVGAQQLDPAARGMPMLARLLILPGAAALWPLLAWRWLRRRPPPLA